MSHKLAGRTWRHCRQLALPRSGIVLVLGGLAIVLWLSRAASLVNQQYEVYAINGHPLPVFLEPDGRIIPKYRPTFLVSWTFVGGARAGGMSGCNLWRGGRVSLGLGRLDFSSVWVTAMACYPAAVTEIESDFGAAISKVKRWRRDGAELVLEGDGVTMRLAPSASASRRRLGDP